MYRYLLILILPLTAFSGTLPGLDALVERYVEERQFQGTILVERKGEVLYQKTVGKGLTENSRFGIGSISKQFTAAAILILQEEGKLHVKDELKKHFEVPDHWQGITIHHLLTHTSGLQLDIPQEEEEFFKFHSTQELLEKIKKSSLVFAPGEKYSYSNCGYTVLASLVEKVSGRSFEEFLKIKIFGPAGLANTGLIIRDDVPALASSTIHHKGKIYDFNIPPYFSNFIGSGSVYSTIEDMVRWMRFVRERRFLSKDSWEHLLTRHVLAYEGPKFYGYGWILEDFLSQKVIWHSGMLGGFGADAVLLEKEELITLILSNVRHTGPQDQMSLDLLLEASQAP